MFWYTFKNVHENMKKIAIKKQPKSHIIFHKNGSSQDSYIMTLSAEHEIYRSQITSE